MLRAKFIRIDSELLQETLPNIIRKLDWAIAKESWTRGVGFGGGGAPLDIKMGSL